MKPLPTFKILLLVLFAATSVIGQELPSGLLLPPLPQPTSRPTSAKILPGLPGGPAPTYVPASQLTLPEKPTLLIASSGPLRQSMPGLDGDPAPEALQLTPTDPIPAADSKDGLDDLLPAPDQLPPPSDLETSTPEPSAGPDAGAGDSAPPLPVPGTPDSTTPAASEPTSVPDSELSPTPRKGNDSASLTAPGPIFRVPGGEAFSLTRQLGYRFTPSQGIGRRDGMHTVASQVPNVLTSEVHGPRMMQMRPSLLWSTAYIENTFFMFCDASYNAVRLAPGWKIRGIQLQGPDWSWVACPRSGANTASFSIRIRSWKTPNAPAQGTVVTLQGLALEGPPGALDWKAAFPDLTKPALSAKR